MTYSIAVLPDIHFPFHDWRALRCVLEYLRAHRWDAVVQLGDLLDLDFLSRFVEGQPGVVEGRRLADDFEEGRQFLEELVSAARRKNKDAKVFVLEGNHEARIVKTYDKSPHLKGLLDVPRALAFDDVDVTWVEADTKGDVLRFDWNRGAVAPRVYSAHEAPTREGVAFVHGWYHSMHHAKATIERFGCGPIFYGHTHDAQVVTAIRYGARSVRGGSLGCLCKLNQGYTKGRPTRWQHAFGVFHLDDERPGDFDLYVPHVNDGRFIGPDGRTYTCEPKTKSKPSSTKQKPSRASR